MWKNYLIASLSGFILAAAWPTYGFSLLVFAGFVPLLYVEEHLRNSASKRRSLHLFFSSYLTFLIWNVITTWWIWNSTPEGAIFALLVNSLLMTLVFFIYHLVAKRKPAVFSRIFLVALWLAFEKFHLEWQFSWPWLNLGNVFSEQPQWVQWYAYTGTLGGSLWIWVVNLSIYSAVRLYPEGIKPFIQKLLLSLSLIVVMIYFSLYEYHTYHEEGRGFDAVVVQPNTDPYTEKYHRPMGQIAEELTDLARPQMNDSVQFILAPETVLSRMTTLRNFMHSRSYNIIRNFLVNYPNSSFITGIDLYRVIDADKMPTPTANPFTNVKGKWYESYNAALFLSRDTPPETYYKSKLVVGVEHFPYRSLLMPVFGDILIAHGSSPNVLTPQPNPTVFTHPLSNVKAAPVICYESIYGEHIGKFVVKGAEFLAIITNDSWWGETEGHRQLQSYARLRAVEMRKSIARSANSGISSFINARGDVLKTLPYNTQGALRGHLYANNIITYYARYGDYIGRIAGFVAILFGLIGLFIKPEYRKNNL